MEDIKVSIIIPVYGVEKYLSRCLDSLTNQTLREIEIIVINDCSPDHSQTIIQNYTEKDNRIISIYNEINIGQGLSRMKGLEFAHGEYVAFVDSDDYVELNMYDTLYSHAIRNDYDVVGSDLKYSFSDGSIKFNQIDPEDLKTIDYNYILNKLFEFENSNYIPSSMCDKLYRLSFLKKNNISIISERIYFLEDLIFNIEIFVCKPKIGWISKTFYNYEIHNGSTMYSYHTNFTSRYLAMYDRIKTVIREKEMNSSQFIDSLNFNLFTTTFAFVSNIFLSSDNIYIKIKSLVLILKNKRLKENAKTHSAKEISFHSTKFTTKLFKYTIFFLMKYL